MTHTAELARRACHGAFALIVCLSAVAVLVAGCETSSTITAGPDPVKCQVSLAAPPMIDAGGGTGTLDSDDEPRMRVDRDERRAVDLAVAVLGTRQCQRRASSDAQ